MTSAMRNHDQAPRPSNPNAMQPVQTRPVQRSTSVQRKLTRMHSTVKGVADTTVKAVAAGLTGHATGRGQS